MLIETSVEKRLYTTTPELVIQDAKSKASRRKGVNTPGGYVEQSATVQETKGAV